jgi:RNA polymerase sigma factor (sigma-70 family)
MAPRGITRAFKTGVRACCIDLHKRVARGGLDEARRRWRKTLKHNGFDGEISSCLEGMVAMSDRSDASFPNTRLSVLRAAGSADPEVRRAALDVLAAVYWRPVYARYRIKWRVNAADAEDLAQEFFTRAVGDGLVEDYDPARAKFRTYLRTCADRFAANARRDQRRLKRGGEVTVVSLDTAGMEQELERAGAFREDADPDAWFDREWVRGLFADAVERLRAETAGTPRQVRFELLRRYDLAPEREADRPSYRTLAAEFDLPVTRVTNHLAWARRELRRLLLERVRSLSGSDAEYRDEVAAVLGTGAV